MEFEFGEDQLEEEQALISASITDQQLHSLTNSHDLNTVTFLQLAVDSDYVPVCSLGTRLPALEQLKLTGSNIASIRHLGTALLHLRVLWLCRCGLAELDGLSALPQLQELYLAFNDINKLSPLTEAEELLVLDVEANIIEDFQQVEFLQLMPTLQEVTLRGNPVCDTPTFRADTLEMLPKLQLLDDEPREVTDGPSLESELDVAQELLEAVQQSVLPSPRRECCSAAASPSSIAERRELRMVMDGIKYAEVGRVYDVSADGRATLGGNGSASSSSRPSTAWPLLNAWASTRPATASILCRGDNEPPGSGREPAAGSDSSPVRSAPLRPLSASARALLTTAYRSRSGGARFRPVSARPSTAAERGGVPGRPGTARPGGSADESASDLTMTGEVLCGVHKLRAHKLQREVAQLGETQTEESALAIEEELMEELRAVKIQQLLGGDAEEEESNGSLGEAEPEDSAFLMLADDDEAAEAAMDAGADVLRLDSRPTSSQDITPTHTPDSPNPSGCGGDNGAADGGIEEDPSLVTSGAASGRMRAKQRSPSPTGRHPGVYRSRISAKGQNAPPVLRHLQMPVDPALANAAAEILQL